MTSLELKSEVMEVHNLHLQEKYRKIRETEVRYDTWQCDDADYVIVAFGSAARLAQKAIDMARDCGIKAGLSVPLLCGRSLRSRLRPWRKAGKAYLW